MDSRVRVTGGVESFVDERSRALTDEEAKTRIRSLGGLVLRASDVAREPTESTRTVRMRFLPHLTDLAGRMLPAPPELAYTLLRTR
jgi:hypothetical protein